MLELRGDNLPIEVDEMGDGTNAQGTEPRDISDDLDLRRAYGGWAPIDQQHFGPGGSFDCTDPLVLCGSNPVPIGGDQLVLIALQTYGEIDLLVARDGQLAVAFDRMGTAGTIPDNSGAFGAADLVLIADLTNGSMFELVYNGSFQARDTVGRARIVGDTVLFVMPLGPAEEPRYRVVTFERIPAGLGGAERTDTLPGGHWTVDSFFDITYSLDVINR